MLRTNFDNTTKEHHRFDHTAIHNRLNTVIYADDYANVQLALDDAATRKIPIVLLNPTKTYIISSTISIPGGVTLDGGARGVSATYGAQLRASVALNPMLTLGNYATVIGCNINLNNTATVGILLQGNHQTITSCWIQNVSAIAIGIKAGGALYSAIRYTQITGSGRALDALNSYSLNAQQTYYGINHGTSEHNIFGCSLGVRIEGLMASYHDNFEIVCNGEAALVVGDTIQGQLDMTNPYFELQKGGTTLVAIKVKAPSRINLFGGEIFGDPDTVDRAGSIAIQSADAYGLKIIGTQLLRWESGLAGALAANAQIMIGGCVFGNVDTPNALTNTENADISLMHPAVS